MGAGSRSQRRSGERVQRTTRSKRAAKGAAKGGTLKFTIPSAKSAIRDVHRQIMDEVERRKYDEKSVFGIRLALEEGLVNAVMHGNKQDESKSVRVEAKVTGKSTQITIEDEGSGFIREGVPDPCCKENLLKPSGRGILLMEAYMDKIQYTRGGRRVRMIKKNEA